MEKDPEGTKVEDRRAVRGSRLFRMEYISQKKRT
jgi:hypothetical protein